MAFHCLRINSRSIPTARQAWPDLNLPACLSLSWLASYSAHWFSEGPVPRVCCSQFRNSPFLDLHRSCHGAISAGAHLPRSPSPTTQHGILLGFIEFCLHHLKLSFCLLVLLNCLLIVYLVYLCILDTSHLDLWLFTVSKTLPMYLNQKLIKTVKRTILYVCVCIGSCVCRFMCVAALCMYAEAGEQPWVVFLIYHLLWCIRTGVLTAWVLPTSVKLVTQDLHATHRELRVQTQLLSGSWGSNPGPHVCVVSTFPTEVSHASHWAPVLSEPHWSGLPWRRRREKSQGKKSSLNNWIWHPEWVD